jgi:SAM-dependent methyltransferase
MDNAPTAGDLASQIPCVACGSDHVETRTAVIAPFISEYVLQQSDTLTRIMRCRECTMMFYALRPDESDMQKLYAGYRGERYFTIRNKNEFWYTRRFHQSLGAEDTMPARRKSLLQNLARGVPLESVETVLDYGGDRGQILAEGPGSRRFVYEMSEVTPEPGIEKITREQDLKPAAYDLVLLLHVLEHVSDPLGLLRKLKTLLSDNGVLFIEVPSEAFNIHNIPGSRWYARYLSWLIRHKWVWQLMSFYSAFFRIFCGVIPPLGFAVAHEHINLFTLKALKTILEKSGFTTEDVFYDAKTGNICAIAKYIRA